MKLTAILVACLIAFSSAQVCGDSEVEFIQTGEVELGTPTTTFAQTEFVVTFEEDSLGVYAQLFYAFALAGFQGACSQQYYALSVDEVHFENLNTAMRFTMDYEYNVDDVTYTSQWTKVKLTYIVVSSEFESYDATNGGNYIWAGSAEVTVDASSTLGLFEAGSVFSNINDIEGTLCGYLAELPNSNTPVFDTVCPAADRIVPHYYIMGFEFEPGTFEIGASAEIPNYLAGDNTAEFGQGGAQNFGPLVELNQFSGGLKKLKVGIVLTTLRNYAVYPNSDQDFSYSGVYMPVSLFNEERPVVQGFIPGDYNLDRYSIPKLTYQFYGLSSFSIDLLGDDCTSLDVNVELRDLYTVIVQTDNVDELDSVFVSADLYTKNTNDLCTGTNPVSEMVEITQKTYFSVPDLVDGSQNIRQTSTDPMIWQVTGNQADDSSQLITFNIELTFENFTPGNGYRFTTSLSEILAGDFATAFTGIDNPYVRFIVSIDDAIVSEETLVIGTATFPHDVNFGLRINTATPTVKFQVVIPRPTDTGAEFNALIQLLIEEYEELYDPVTDCCVEQCPEGSAINIDSDPASCIVCDGDESLQFDAATGVCACQIGFYNILEDSANGGIICFPCLGNLCLSCSASDPTTCDSCVVGADDSTGSCECTEGFFEENGQCTACPAKCTTCSVAGVCDECADSVNRDINQNCSCNAGFYDAGVALCATCNPICRTCSNETTCTACFEEDNRTLVNGQCVCRSGFYQFINTDNTISCEPCDPECEECTSPTVCVDCDGDANRILGYDDFGRQTCVCAPGFTAISDGSCVQNGCVADPFCLQCDTARGVSVCIQCIASTNRVLSIPEYACVCKEGYYEDNGACVPCSEGCAACSSATQCDRCAVIATANNDGTCTCPSSYFFEVEPIRYCKRCNDFCLNCTNDDSCDLCLPGFNATTNGECICPRGFYVNDQLQCVACIGDCQVCETSTECTLCAPSFFLQNGSCVRRCDPGFYASGVVCAACQEGCSFCETAGTCLVCNPGIFSYNGLCYTNCPNGTIPDNEEMVCVACNEPCGNCVQHPSKCLTCVTGNYFEFGCHAECPVGTYNNNGICEYCSFECAACVGSASTCVACAEGEYLFEGGCFEDCPIPLVNNRCPNLCPAGFFTSSTNACVACNDRCASCSGSANNCTSCVNGLAYQGNCVTSCPSATFNSNGNCVACATGCTSCSGSSTNCQTCAAGYLQSGSRCILECGAGRYYDNALQSCRRCNTTCATCSNANTCTSCANSQIQPINGACSECLYPCSSCESLDVCTGCLDGFVLSNGRCITRCPAGSTANNGVCVCATGAFSNGICVASCPSGTTNVNGNCQTCNENCAQCSGATDSCTSCPQGFVLNAVTRRCEVNTNCQLGEYFRSETRQCTRICPSGTSYQDSICLTECLEGFRDNGFGACVEQVLASGCSFPYFYQQGACVSTCSAGSFPNSNTRVCEACSSNCFSCMSASFCTSCRSGFDLSSNGLCITGRLCANGQLKFNGVCLNSCPVGTVASGGYCERRCDPNTYFFDNKCYAECPANLPYRTSVACVSSCSAGYVLEGSVCRLSVQTCPSGNYYNAQTGQCAECAYPCAECQFTQSYCTGCSNGLTLSANRCIESNSCGSGSYRNGNGRCAECPEKCNECVSATECSTCANGYEFNGFDCVLRLSDLEEVTISQSNIYRRDNTVFIAVNVNLIPNGLTSEQKNNFFVVIPSSNDNVVRVNQFPESSSNNAVWVAIEYETYPSITTVFISLNAELLATSYANVGYTATENSFISVVVSTSVSPAPSDLQIPMSVTNSLATKLVDVPLVNKALRNAVIERENYLR